MKRVCFISHIRRELLDEYRAAHAAVDREMLGVLFSAGISNYSIFINNDGLLVGYFEADNPEESLTKVGFTEANKRWQEKMSPYFEKGSGDMREGSLEWMEQIFYLP